MAQDDTPILYETDGKTFFVDASAQVSGSQNLIYRDHFNREKGTNLQVSGNGNEVVFPDPDSTQGEAKNFVSLTGVGNEITAMGNTDEVVIFANGDFNSAILGPGDDKATVNISHAPASFHEIDGGEGHDTIELYTGVSEVNALTLVNEGHGAFRVEGERGTIASLTGVEELRFRNASSATPVSVDLTSLSLSADTPLQALPTTLQDQEKLR